MCILSYTIFFYKLGKAEFRLKFTALRLNCNVKLVNLTIETYSVMQSDGNSFCGDVVSDSFNNTFRDEYNILDQIYKSKYVCSYNDYNSL